MKVCPRVKFIEAIEPKSGDFDDRRSILETLREPTAMFPLDKECRTASGVLVLVKNVDNCVVCLKLSGLCWHRLDVVFFSS